MFEFAFSKIGYALDRCRTLVYAEVVFLYISMLKNNRVYDETSPIHNDFLIFIITTSMHRKEHSVCANIILNVSARTTMQL